MEAYSGACEASSWSAALPLVMSRLSPSELGRCRVVCRLWREVASSAEVRREVFLSRWQLGGLYGQPRNPALQDTATLSHFVRRNQVARADSVTGLALRHGCGVTAIKRLNNLISDHSLHSRENVFLPVSSASELVGRHVLFEYCRNASREVLVLLTEEETREARAAALQRAHVEGGEAGMKSRSQEEALQCKLVAMLSRSLRLDAPTARFYLTEAGGCVKRAVALCEQDMRWESTASISFRRAPPLNRRR